VTEPDDHAPPPSCSDGSTSSTPDAPASPAMQTDHSLIVNVVKGSRGPSEHKADTPEEKERR